MTRRHRMLLGLFCASVLLGCQETSSDDKKPGRNMSNRVDDFSGFQVQVMYILPAGAKDRELDINGAISNMVSSINTWLYEKTGATFRFDTYQGEPDVLFYRMAQSNAALADSDIFLKDVIERELEDQALIESDKLYAVVYDGSSTKTCGGGAAPGSRYKHTAAMYLQTDAPNYDCIKHTLGESPTQPAYLELAMLHEVVHTLGYAPQCSPHHYGPNPNHVDDKPTDLMYGGPLGWEPKEIDADHDDYYKAYLPGCYDLANSAVWNPQPANAELPPMWNAQVNSNKK